MPYPSAWLSRVRHVRHRDWCPQRLVCLLVSIQVDGVHLRAKGALRMSRPNAKALQNLRTLRDLLWGAVSPWVCRLSGFLLWNGAFWWLYIVTGWCTSRALSDGWGMLSSISVFVLARFHLWRGVLCPLLLCPFTSSSWLFDWCVP